MGQKNQHKLCLYKTFQQHFGSWMSAPKSWTSKAKSALSCGPNENSFVLVFMQNRTIIAWYRSWFSGRGWGQQLCTFQSPAFHWMARTSSRNCLSCRNPHQAPHSLNCLPPFTENPFFHWKVLRRIPSPKIGSDDMLQTHGNHEEDESHRNPWGAKHMSGGGNGNAWKRIQMTFKMVIGNQWKMKGWLWTPRQ